MINKTYIAIKHNFVTFAKTPASMILVILPVVMLFVFGVIYPVGTVLPQVITISIITVSFSFVGIQFIEYRQNKFFRTNKSISMSNSVFILGTFITLVLILTLASMTLITITWFFTQPIHLLQQTVDNIYYDEIDSLKQFLTGKEFFSAFTIANINWIEFAYAMCMSIVMTSLLAILVGSMFKSVKSFTVLTLTYLILYVVLGGLALPYNVIHQSTALTFLSELIPNTHTNNLITTAMNEGNTEDAYNYIYYTNAICDWTSNIVDLYNNGQIYNSTDLNVIMDELDLIGTPEVNEEWLDPLQSGLVSVMFPWADPLMQTLSELFFGIKIELDPISVITTWYWVTALGDDIDTQEGFIEIVVTFYTLYNDIGTSLELLIHPDPFTLKTTYGIITNAIPALIIVLTLPNFILIGREE